VNKLQNFATASGPADWMFLQPAILDHMHDPVIVTDLAGTVIGCNRAAFEMFGYASEELIGRMFPSCILLKKHFTSPTR
jgi:PAS domain S-box-containing protein